MEAHIIEEDTIQPLVLAVTFASNPPRHPKLPWWRRLYSQLQLPSAVLVILVWNTMVGVSYSIVLNGGLVYSVNKSQGFSFLYGYLGVIMVISVIQFFLYPLGGLIADIKCGRYKIVIISNMMIWCGYGFLIVLVFLLAFAKEKYTIKSKNGRTLTYFQGITIGIILILFTLGFTGFQANVVQFGLDQFQDAPSEKLSRFLHWFVWTDTIGQAITTVEIDLFPCMPLRPSFIMLSVTPPIIFIILSVSTTISRYKRHWFHREPCTHNPYGTVYRVLKFAAKHDKHLQRSAFTFADDQRPSRIDFAKLRFGGPFTTETVEDVKTFLRILVMLVAIGPTYIVIVSAKYLFPLHGIFTIHQNVLGQNDTCNSVIDWTVLASGNLTYLVSIASLPLYILFLPFLKNRLPKIVPRLAIGLTLLLLADLSMTLSQLAGHYHLQKHYPERSQNMSCLFNTSYAKLRGDNGTDVITLGLPSWTLIFPNVLNGLAMPLIYISILEFISAQSPHSMKGVLLGVFYAVRGLFTVLGCVLVFPFTSERIWGRRENTVLDCGLSYYVASVLLGLMGVLLFCAAARWYQYRRREDQPFGPHYAEAAYERQIRGRDHEVASEPVTKSPANKNFMNYESIEWSGTD